MGTVSVSDHVALSLAEAKYMAASTASCEAIWLRKLLMNLLKKRMEPTRILCDNQSCIKLAENPVFMTGQSTLKLGATSSKTMSNEELYIEVHSYMRTGGRYPHKISG